MMFNQKEKPTKIVLVGTGVLGSHTSADSKPRMSDSPLRTKRPKKRPEVAIVTQVYQGSLHTGRLGMATWTKHLLLGCMCSKVFYLATSPSNSQWFFPSLLSQCFQGDQDMPCWHYSLQGRCPESPTHRAPDLEH